jgi:hypothetical protein
MAKSTKWTTWVSDEPEAEPPSDHETPAHGPRPPITYANPDDVPKSVRDSIRWSYEGGLSTQQLQKIFELPIEWIEMWVHRPH